MKFQVDDLVVTSDGRVARVLSATPHDIPGTSLDMGRYKLEFADRSTLENAPGYLMHEATEEEIVRALPAGEHGNK